MHDFGSLFAIFHLLFCVSVVPVTKFECQMAFLSRILHILPVDILWAILSQVFHCTARVMFRL